ncbi:hypothetical protein [Roseateles violae]|uniref:MSHA biogenesis protein MshK n=1 Tax=Roseateles violae TaxID=3058042 RepID=A0ABT8DX61_9BURK|nr:hypothetical protein [Pelomonas sp. PFR6]MDN3921694.1 hypothetical protein [Pelomonas sp. PFR6]
MLVLLACLGHGAMAQPQPPAETSRSSADWLTPQPGAFGMPGTGSSSDAAAGDAGAGLRVTLVGPTRRLAVIDGETLKIGNIHNGARLLDIRSNGVVLLKDGQRETLSMSPAVVKTPKASAGSKPGETARARKSNEKKAPGAVRKGEDQ